MNLIEQLGGYDEAKNEFESMRKYPELYAGEFDKNDAMLLQYRRDNNIFEVGDKVVVRKDVSIGIINFNYMRIHTVSETMSKHGVDFVCLDSFLYRSFVVLDAISHATPEEIKAGKRLN